MSLIIGKLLGFEQESTATLRSALENNGLRQVYHGRSHNENLSFNDEKILPDQLVVIGYDKDLDIGFKEWLTSYQQKDPDEPMSVYTMSVDDATKVLGPRYSTMKTSRGQIEVPTLKTPTKFTTLPLERKDLPLAVSIERNVILPTELLCQIYVPADTNLMDIMASFGSVFGYPPSEENYPDSSCTGRVTLPVALFTGKGNGSTEYVMATEELEAVIYSQENYVNDNKANNFSRRSLHHAQSFVNKYSKLLKP